MTSEAVAAQLERCYKGSNEDIKVTYVDRSGYATQAYVHPETLEGTNKHSDVAVVLERVEEGVEGTTGILGTCYYRQVDDWEWKYDGFEGLKRVVEDDE